MSTFNTGTYMLWLNHPKPAGNRKPVELLLQRERMRHENAGPDLGPRTVQGLSGTERLLAPAEEAVPESLELSVRYSLAEYTGFTWQHCGYLIRRRRVAGLPGWWLNTKCTATAALHFAMQGRSRRTYDFTIDIHGVVRSSGTGVTLVPWRDISAVRRYPRCYMLVLARGTLPIPLRCLDRAQIAAMEGFAALVRAKGC